MSYSGYNKIHHYSRKKKKNTFCSKREAASFSPLKLWMDIKDVHQRRGKRACHEPHTSPCSFPPSWLTMQLGRTIPSWVAQYEHKISSVARKHARISQSSTWLWYLSAGLSSHSSFATGPRSWCWVLLSLWNPEAIKESFNLGPNPRSDLEIWPDICCPFILCFDKYTLEQSNNHNA